MTYDASSRKDIRKAEKAAAQTESEDVAYLRHIMSTYAGRGWMYRYLAWAGMFQETFVPTNTHATAYNLGRTNAVKPLWSIIFNRCAPQYVLMMQEQEPTNVSSPAGDPDLGPAEPTGPDPVPGRDDPGPIDGGTDPAAFVDASGFVRWPN